MKRFSLFFRRHTVQLLCITLLTLLFPPIALGAGTLTGISVSIGNPKANTSTAYSLSFTTTTTSFLKQIDFQFSTIQDGVNKPAHLNLAGAALNELSGLGTGWSLNTSQNSNGIIYLTRSEIVSIDANTSVSAVISNITNSSIDDCEPGNNGLKDSCHIKVTTYSDDGSNEIDIGYTTYTVTEDPQCTFSVNAVASGSTNNGITATSSSTDTTIPFGLVTSGTARYVTHAITITTNAPGGYTVIANLAEPIMGVNGHSVVDPFGAVNATWTTPQNWSTPDGTEASYNSGWLGLNTTDKNTAGWSGNTSSKFGPFGATPRIVATSTGPARSGTTIYVTYALGINGYQPGDSYEGLIIYDVRAVY